MAKKKKSTRSKKKADAAALDNQSPFRHYSFAVIFMFLALLIMLGGFKTGGVGPKGIFNVLYWIFGWAAWFSVFGLIYIGVHMFKSEDHKMPVNRLSGLLAMLLFGAGFFFTVLSKEINGSLNTNRGGHVGRGVGNI